MSTMKKMTAASAACLEVIDPCNRTGKITVPLQYITETRGVNELARPADAKDMSLCLLFQKGRCNAGARCHQIHADPDFVTKLRAQAAAGSACCALHGDFNSASYLSAGLMVEVMTNGTSVRYSMLAFGRTQTMDQLVATAGCAGYNIIRVNSNKICRLHSQGRCKFGKDCKNIHMCPNAQSVDACCAALKSPAPKPLSGFSRPTAAVASTFAARKGAPALDVSRSELEASSQCGLSIGMGALSPSPSDTCERSLSASHHGLSSVDNSSPDESPKEKTFSLFNRCVSSSSEPVAAPKRLSFSPEPITPMDLCNLGTVLDMPMHTTASSPNALFAEGFERTMALIAQDVGADCAPLTASPKWF
jgi:hypothetical protein